MKSSEMQLNETIISLQQQVEFLNNKVAAFEENEMALRDSLNKMNMDSESLRLALADKANKVDIISADNDQLRKEVAEMKVTANGSLAQANRLEEITKENKRLQEELETNTVNYNHVNMELDTLQASSLEAINKLQIQLSEEKSRVQDLAVDLELANSNVETGR